jgi:hypothetical protein
MAKLSKFLTAASCDTVTANFTFPLVYSWPGYDGERMLDHGFHVQRGGGDYVDFCVIWQTGQSFVQRLVHLRRRSLEETSTACGMLVCRNHTLHTELLAVSLTSNEKGVSRKHGLVVAVFEKEANGILGMAWSVQGGDFDGVTHFEC